MPHTLLLADDSVTIQRVIELTFADQDIVVIAVSDGDQAIERLNAAPPDIVLADIGMPGKNGYEVAQYIRRTPNLSHIPVMLLTGAFEPVDHARATEAGCDGVLAKPFEPQLVIGRVKDLLARGRQGGGAVNAHAAAPAPPPRAAEQWLPPVNQTFTTPAPAAPPRGEPAALDDYFDRLDAAFASMSAPQTSAAPPPPPPPPIIARPTAAASPLAPPEIDWFSSAPAPGAAQETWDLPSPGPAAADAPDLPLAFAPSQPARPFSWPPHVAAASARADVSAPGADDAETFFVPAAAKASAQGAPATAPAPAEVPPPLAAAAAVTPPAAAAAVPPVAAPAPQAPRPSVPATELPSLGDAFAALLAAEHHEQSASEAPAWPGTMVAAAPAITDALIDDVVRRVLEQMSDQVVRDTTADLVSRIAERLVREEIEKIRASLK